jgi:predicted amidophosphoribosyltransferase
MENNCPSCGKAVQAADIFCTACGMNLEVEMEHTA